MSFLNRLKKAKDKLIDDAAKLIEVAPEELAAERIAICHGCPHLMKPLNNCSKCGCFMDGKTKLKNAACPIGKW